MARQHMEKLYPLPASTVYHTQGVYSLRVMTINCGTVAHKVSRLHDLLEYTAADVVLLQEVGPMSPPGVPTPPGWLQASTRSGALLGFPPHRSSTPKSDPPLGAPGAVVDR